MTLMVLAHRFDDVFLVEAGEITPIALRRHCTYASTTVSTLITRNSLLADMKEAADESAWCSLVLLRDLSFTLATTFEG